LGTNAKPPIVRVIANPARIIIGFRPNLSARMPQIGDKNAADMADIEIPKPA